MIEFIDIDTNRMIGVFHNIKLEMPFVEGEEIVVEGKYYSFVKKSYLFYRDADGEKMVTNIFLKK